MREHSQWYVSAMERLLAVVQELSQAKTLEEVMAVVRLAARSLTGADGATFVLRDGDYCYYAEENAISPLWKGKRFPLETCISGWTMMHSAPAVIEDIYQDPRIPIDAYRPTFVKSLAMVPIRRGAPIGAIGNYWANRRQPSQEEVAILQALADTTSVALENVRLYGDLQAKITTLEEREQRIKEQRDALEVFTRALAHDLKEPMRIIHSFTQLIAQQESFSAKGQGYFQHVQNATQRMLMLIETVFLYTQLDDPKHTLRKECDSAAALAEAQANLRPLIEERGAVITAEGLPHVLASHAQLVQLLQSLLTNAMQYCKQTPNIHVSAVMKDGRWLFAVRDNGPGIAPEDAEKIFAPFKRLRHAGQEGAGLGLATCRKIVQAHEGKIWCESPPEKGATFFFTLPVLPENKPADAAPAAPQSANPIATVLLVDDRKPDLTLSSILLTEQFQIRCNLLEASGGDEALNILREARRRGAPVQLMLLDINMPGMDGFELLERMSKEGMLPETTVIMCTGSTYSKDVENAEAMGAIGYLTKPLELQPFEHVLRKVKSLRLDKKDEGYALTAA